MTTSFKLNHSLLLLSLAAAYPLQTFAAAGVAQFTTGDVNVRNSAGQTSPLTKGKDIESGEAIVTGASGRAQVKFTDGGLISLQPNTEFKIASYADKLDAKDDRFLVDLVRGSMRAITGLIGKRNRDNYRVTTTTATIGIRGSGFNAGYNPDNSLGVTAEKDEIEVCNAGVCVGLVAGESVTVVNATTPPQRTVNRAAVPTPGPAQQPVVAGNQANSEGKSSLLAGVVVEPGIPNPGGGSGSFNNLLTYSQYNTSVSGAVFLSSTNAVPTVVSAGLVDSFGNNVNNIAFTPNTGKTGGYEGTAGGDFIGWGNWDAGTNTFGPYSTPVNYLHYVVGVPTAVMPTGPVGAVNYTFLGGGTPILYNGTVGTLSSASTFSVDFSTSVFTTSIMTSFGTINTSNTFMGNAFTSGAGEVKGFFAGPGAVYAGMVYTGFNAASSGYYSGSVVFKAPSNMGGGN